ncbi:hypothetical protein RFI_11905, partial [Reticulomyxa filosa]
SYCSFYVFLKLEFFKNLQLHPLQFFFIFLCLYETNGNKKKKKKGKLQSIDWLQNAEQGIVPTLPTLDVETVEFKDESGPPVVPNGSGGGDAGAPAAPAAPAPPQPAQDPIKSDPNLQSWFKMLKVGVPAQAVSNKMAQAGVDDDVIEKGIVGCNMCPHMFELLFCKKKKHKQNTLSNYKMQRHKKKKAKRKKNTV